MTTLAIVDNGAEVKEQALAWPDQARALKVVDPESYVAGGELLKGIKGLRQRIAETFDPHIKRAHEAHRALLAEKSAAEAPLTEAESIIKRALVAYDTEQERLRREEQRRLEEEARKREEERRLAEAAALEAEALATGDAAAMAEAHELVTAPVEVAPVIVAKATPKVAGISFRETWSAIVTDKHALICFVAANPQYNNLIEPNMTALNQMARGLKGSMPVSGVKAVSRRDAAARVQ